MAEESDACSVAHGTGPAAASTAPAHTAPATTAAPGPGPAAARGPAGGSGDRFPVLAAVPGDLDGADVVVTDHHRGELGPALRDALAGKARWVGIMGNPHHAGPHVAALEELGVAPGDIARVHRPIGLNIGSRTPPEIAVSTLARALAGPKARPRGLPLLTPPLSPPETR